MLVQKSNGKITVKNKPKTKKYNTSFCKKTLDSNINNEVIQMAAYKW